MGVDEWVGNGFKEIKLYTSGIKRFLAETVDAFTKPVCINRRAR